MKNTLCTLVLLGSFFVTNSQITELSNGNVGIGTSNPGAKLEIFGGGDLLIRGSNNDAGDIIFRNNNSAQLGRIWSDLGGTSGLYLSSGDIIPDIAIANNGNIGMGTTNPTSKLELFGGGDLLFRGTGNDAGDIVFRKNNLTQLGRIWTAIDGSSTLYLSSGDINPDITIDGNGRVGIGTMTPNELLTVAGNINTREVKVTVNAGADFVFDKKYKLPKLNEVEHFIKKNRHLPQIESAKEMEENGIKLSKMNIKLLQKIEELTLYIIAHDKEILELKKEVIELRE